MTIVSREKLYEEIWAEPATIVAARYGVSSNFLGRVCAQLNIPRPPRGYWAKLKEGQKVEKPPLPPAKPGDALEWARGGEPRIEPFPPNQAREKAPRAPSEKHPLIRGVLKHFETVRASKIGYLKPWKKIIVDIFVSKDVLNRALETANQLFFALEDEGYPVAMALHEKHYRRPEVDHREKPLKEAYDNEHWSPDRPTVVIIDSVAIGLTLYELSEEAEAKYSEGKYVRVSSLPLKKKVLGSALDGWTTKHDFPSGRLVLRAYCAHRGVAWQKQWIEPTPGELPDQFDDIIKELKSQATTLAKQIEEVEKRWELEKQRAAERERERQREEDEKRRAQSRKASREQLVSIIDSWAGDIYIERFFEDMSKRVDKMEGEEKATLLARIEQARQLIGDTDPIRYFRSWKSPEEHLAEAERARTFWPSPRF